MHRHDPKISSMGGFFEPKPAVQSVAARLRLG
jgi:hypothetical protein